MTRKEWIGLVLPLMLLPAAPAADWPQWRGPERDGRSGEIGLLQTWPPEGPDLIYSVAGIGQGFSSLAVSNGLVFTMGDSQDLQYVTALNDSDGSVEWKAQVGVAHQVESYSGARSTPTVDGDRLYALGTEGDLVCLRISDGREIWRRNLKEDFGGRMMSQWKYAESVLVDGDKVVVTPGGPQAGIVALNKTTGEEIWRAAIPDLGEKGADGAGYASIAISHGAGLKQYVQLMGRGVVGVEAATGRFLWGYNRIANDIANIPTPIIEGDYVFTSTSYGTGSALLELVQDGDGVRAEEVYFLAANVMANHHGGIILHDGYLYAGTGRNRGYPTCVEMTTGEPAWGPMRNDGTGSAAVAYADGHLYLLYQSGLVLLLEATPRQYREKGSFTIPGAGETYTWSHPVIANGRLYLRAMDNLHVYDVSAANGPSD